jgi:BsuBI/PstI restriction endonuclease domain/BsuBI/PstI restriction endonuclease HTH domain
MILPALLQWQEVQSRLKIVFPEGTSQRGFLTRDIAARTVFVALYIGAVEGSNTWLAPKHVYRMSGEQAESTGQEDRIAYALNVMKPRGRAPGVLWYADNSRESIRDETLREALVTIGAAVEKSDVPTTSGKPRYALQAGFAALFNPSLEGVFLDQEIATWQSKVLTKGALARVAIVRSGAAASGGKVSVVFPSGETMRLKPGPSSKITKAVIEVFAHKFLHDPAVLFVSESGNKVVAHQDKLARQIGLQIESNKNLPDTILVDLGPEHPLLVFVEVVATDGPINTRRKKALEEIANKAGFPAQHIAFVTAYLDRSGAPFKKTIDTLAWGSYAWFVSEPDSIVILTEDLKKLR